MRSFFIFNGVLELIAGIALVFVGAKVANTVVFDEAHIYLAAMYGVAAISIAILSFLVAKSITNKELVSTFLIFGLVFHRGVSLLNFMISVIKS